MNAMIDKYMAEHPFDPQYAVAFELPMAPQWLVDGASGLGSAFSFGLTDKVQDWMGTSSAVNRSSGAYQGAMAAGIVVSFLDGQGEARFAVSAGQEVLTFNNTAHYAQRLIDVGLDVASTEATVANEIRATTALASEGSYVGSFSGRIAIDGVPLQYNTRVLPNGTINVGTIYPRTW